METSLPNFPIVDAHLHIYDPEAHSYPWMRDAPLLNKVHGKAEYDRATAGIEVEKAVFVEVDIGEGFHLDEAHWVAEAAKGDARVQGVVASMPLEKGAAAVEADVAAFAAMPLARGVRRLIQGHVDEPGWCLRPDFVDGVRLVGSQGLGFDICIYHPQLGDATELVRRCPDVDFILDHIGKPGIKDGIREPWWSQMRELAAASNVICKISGAITEADHKAWTYDQVAPYVAHAIECFGFDRVAFGGDWPVVNLASSYKGWIEVLDRITAGAAEAELRKLYRDNAIRYYRL
jgi:predicted TIM-barrel fold metal-dependent hydrolase